MATSEMSFWDHLDVLRQVLFRVLGVWLVLAVGYFIAMPYLFDQVILAPCHNDFIFYQLLRDVGSYFNLSGDFFTQTFSVKLININLAAPFFIHMSTAFWMSVVTATPYLFYELWKFVSPALYPNERKGVKKALCLGSVMFFIGVAVILIIDAMNNPGFECAVTPLWWCVGILALLLITSNISVSAVFNKSELSKTFYFD